ncbi:exodeoxyribonuclease III [soil metagenome]
MRIATYNVNSIRSRQARILDWMVREDVDVVAMQEIKCTEAQFPFEAFEAAGYEVVLHGLNQWNGVAIASRVPMTDVQIGFDGQPGFLKDQTGPDVPIEARAIGATVNGIRLWSLYVPNGRALGDPHFTYKLDWYSHLAGATSDWMAAHPDEPNALMGDFNVAPLDIDNGDPTVIAGESTHISEPERAAFHELEQIGLTDVVRPHVPEGLFTYWDYKQLRFPRNEGMRIDFVLGSHTFADKVVAAQIHRNERKGEGPSDHVPITVDLNVDVAGDDDDRPMIF